MEGARILTLAVLQGLTEFLPVSSSGHLVLARAWLGVAAPGATLEVALHLGTLLTVAWVYAAPLADLAAGLWRGGPGRRLAAQLAVATLPAALAGLAAGDWITARFTPAMAGWGWAGTTLLLALTPPPARSRVHRLTEVPWATAAAIGLGQALALWPGLSRSGTTIVIARLGGLDPETAAAFSFLLGVPAVAGAVGLEFLRRPPLAVTGWPWLAAAVAVAALAGAVAVQWVQHALTRPAAWRGFAVYTALLAGLGWWTGR
ncbi:Undecaprenyl-diphosphatase [Candidatus Hydrogenisulfobacillus filiaventi]|uniref:Undecaprenyl-diphosphatase n=1 Tax=Candidatus Hydrogenisulfobacillus filiaventi TaxID=2707344 RepID=A0A6F8ZGK7_9FIRM|nr:undecaprenyl-diphosphate phosphatase [Bacillota bacterium]CAB1128888.1 Undecaprenyl-diphosphatase [Candidatus Hydrogenisulfobacillus filiaventi]